MSVCKMSSVDFNNIDYLDTVDTFILRLNCCIYSCELTWAHMYFTMWYLI